MEEKDYILIEDYWYDALSESERQTVEQRVASDAAFAQVFEETRERREWLRLEPERTRLKATTDALGQEFFGQATMELTPENSDKAKVIQIEPPAMKVTSGGRRWWAIAAAVAVLAAAVWFISRPAADLYPQYAMHTPPPFTDRTGPADAGSEAVTAFKKGDYAAALSALQRYETTKPGDATISFYQAVCLLELNRTNEARTLLQTLAQGTSTWRDEARWYIALTWLKEKNIAQCRAALRDIQPGEDRYKQATELLKKLE